MNRPPIIGDTIHYQTEFDSNGKIRAVHASIEGVAKQMTLEPMSKKSTGAPHFRKTSKPAYVPRPRTSYSRTGLIGLPFLLLIIAGVYGYDKFSHRNTVTIDQSSMHSISLPTAPKQTFQCQGKVYCSEMRSREEAEFYLDNCPGTKMDGDYDGIPCEKQF
ncbi:excalibur calcium-binding domain-containing protein [Methylomonas sp. MO1]|uniref:excalibur calcium-binding domain-containing protein n=1 Tax=Methylomonas sp. MO1 TaxID=3073619 RepID=UPI0028A3C09B|nr:excalibur calcium-binding domain-containing protein [Methylomonas sp. MO1]MDT4288436.1 excalibur calcium-binding domain-containing protein [Methylomonas sp. MO1]